jgi:hypothetical protein
VFERLGVRDKMPPRESSDQEHGPSRSDGRPIPVPMTLLSEQALRAQGLSRATMDKILDRAPRVAQWCVKVFV